MKNHMKKMKWWTWNPPSNRAGCKVLARSMGLDR